MPQLAATVFGERVFEEGMFEELDAYARRIPLLDLEAWLGHCDLCFDDVRSFVKFHSDRYLRNLMCGGPAYQALVLCWQNGQRSPIHDHTGSSCCVKVLRGEATETFFQRAPNGMIYATGSRVLREGAMCGSQDDDIHQMSNLQANGAELVTLHVYSPPLLAMNVYSLLDATVSRFIDPINDEFVGGAGI